MSILTVGYSNEILLPSQLTILNDIFLGEEEGVFFIVFIFVPPHQVGIQSSYCQSGWYSIRRDEIFTLAQDLS